MLTRGMHGRVGGICVPLQLILSIRLWETIARCSTNSGLLCAFQ